MSNKTTMINYEATPIYQQVELVGISMKVFGSDVNGSVERNKFTGRKLLTLTEGFDAAAEGAAMIAKGDGTRLIQTVKSLESLAVQIALGDGFKSRALFLKDVLVYTDNKVNKDGTPAKVAFIKWDNQENEDVLTKIRNAAPKMLDSHPDAFDDWTLIDNEGNRVFIYTYSDVNEEGKGVPQD